MVFNKESDFEDALIKVLCTKGWSSEILNYKTEEELIQNWADILFENNKNIDRLNDCPLTSGEMQQIIEQIKVLRTPLKINGFINGGSVSITRDNADDTAHFGKEVSLKIYNRQEIAAGQSRYQIVRQPKFLRKNSILNDRRGDLMLLINGMPVIHIELKKSGIPISHACNQIEKYAHEGVFTGLFSLVQIFVAMNPDETVYFANPGPEGKFNKDFYFHWANFNNDPINNWKDIASDLLSIPMAHLMIGYYTVADHTDGVLKVMRSYQFWAASKISDKVTKSKWTKEDTLGGFVWHTTGSGKTMTSFKSAQLIANSKDANKVVFLMDRIELGTQSLNEYRGFAEETDSVQSTENTGVLITKLKSNDPVDTLIVTSIQKMSNIKLNEDGLNAKDIEIINSKRIVFIVDECHRSTFGDMLIGIKHTFTNAMFFGFTGTPIHDENQKKMNTTASIFGDELHRYSIADGIRDKNVLGFDPVMVTTFDDMKVRKVVALDHAKASTESEALADEKKKKIYLEYMDKSIHPMAGYYNEAGIYVRGIEDDIPTSQYRGNPEHQNQVVKNILDNFSTLSQAGKFHAIFATSSIQEAIEYYRLIKKESDTLKVTAIFDENIDNNEGAVFKEDGLVEIIKDYNDRYDQKFAIPTYQRMKKDIASRLAHKDQYVAVSRTPEKQIDLLIVVDQMLTGFDSKWINTLYLDKLMRYESIIQAFSRTNRLFEQHEKPFGNVRYYRYPHTMKRNIESAVKLYSGDKKISLFVPKLEGNLKKMNQVYEDIQDVFKNAEVPDFLKLPDEVSEKAKFAILFKMLSEYFSAAKIQGFLWEQKEYEFTDRDTGTVSKVTMLLDENTYQILLLRYKELFGKSSNRNEEDIPYDLDGHLTEIDTGLIDNDYMNSRFEKYRKLLVQDGVSQEAIEQALNDLHTTFASLSQEEQKYANVFLHDVQTGDVYVEEGKSLKDYITEYMSRAKNEQVMKVVNAFGLDEKKLNALLSVKVTSDNINEFGRFEDLMADVEPAKAVAFFEKLEGKKVPVFRANMKVSELLRKFIIEGEFDIEQSEKSINENGSAEINYLDKQLEKRSELQMVAEEPNFTSSTGKTKELDILSIGGWVFYMKPNAHDELPSDKCGKWMHFFNDRDFAARICKEAVEKGVVAEAKHTDAAEGVCCFYLCGDDMEAHKRVLQFFMDNKLIRKTKAGAYYNIAFKYDDQTRMGEYGKDFEAELKLDKFIDLRTGEFIV